MSHFISVADSWQSGWLRKEYFSSIKLGFIYLIINKWKTLDKSNLITMWDYQNLLLIIKHFQRPLEKTRDFQCNRWSSNRPEAKFYILKWTREFHIPFNRIPFRSFCSTWIDLDGCVYRRKLYSFFSQFMALWLTQGCGSESNVMLNSFLKAVQWKLLDNEISQVQPHRVWWPLLFKYLFKTS